MALGLSAYTHVYSWNVVAQNNVRSSGGKATRLCQPW
jgi:hypothetical protein